MHTMRERNKEVSQISLCLILIPGEASDYTLWEGLSDSVSLLLIIHSTPLWFYLCTMHEPRSCLVFLGWFTDLCFSSLRALSSCWGICLSISPRAPFFSFFLFITSSFISFFLLCVFPFSPFLPPPLLCPSPASLMLMWCHFVVSHMVVVLLRWLWDHTVRITASFWSVICRTIEKQHDQALENTTITFWMKVRVTDERQCGHNAN